MRLCCWMRAILLLALVGASTAHAQPSGISRPPAIEPPIGINPRTTLPGQRDDSPIFGVPKFATPTRPAPPVPSPPPNPQEPAAPNAFPNSPPATNRSVPSEAPRPHRVPPAPLPQRNYYDNFAPGRVPGPAPIAEGYYAPGTMESPASLMDGNGMPALGFDPHAGPSNGNFRDALRSPPCESGCDNAGLGGMCGLPGACCKPCCCPTPFWFGTVGGLFMGRNDPNRSWLSAQKSDYFNQVMNGADAHAPWTGGWEGTFGRFLPGYGAVQFTYWGLAPSNGFDSVRMPGDLVTPINLNDVYIGGVGADYFYDNAQEHRVWRHDELNNIELNFLGLPAISTGGPFQLTWLAGIRYLRFRDQLIFGAVHEGFEFGSDGGVNEAYLDVATTNNLLGGQIGAFGSWMMGRRWGFFAFPRVGVYANQINQNFQLYRGDGLSAMDIGSNKTVGSLIAQIDVGINFFITPRWSAYVGYRVMGVSGLGLADQQIPAFLIDTPEIRAIDSNSNLILQGATAGLIWWF